MTRVTRHIPFEGIANFRDVGGYKGAANQAVRWQRLYRSAHLAQASSTDLVSLRQLGIGNSVDLRSTKERDQAHYAIDFVETTHLAILPKVALLARQKIEQGAQISTQDAHDFMLQMYQGFVHEQQHEFSAFLHQVLTAQKPVVVHCTAGKDRTGFAIALLLLALGVHEDDVMADYLLSNQFFDKARPSRLQVSKEVMEILWSVRADYLATAIKEINRHHNSILNYLHQKLQFTPLQVDQLRASMLQEH